MHILKVVLQGIGETLILRFKSKETTKCWWDSINRALENREGVTAFPIEIEDDSGLIVKINPYDVRLIQQIDFEKSIECDVTCTYHQQKIQERVLSRLMVESPLIMTNGIQKSGRIF